MRKKLSVALLILLAVAAAGWFLYPRIFPAKQDRKVLYWTDPMLPGDRSDHPGKSPMGMDRVPVYESDSAVPAAQQAIRHDEYYCPMHPQVVRDKPGACPICGMTLVKRVSDGASNGEVRPARTGVSLSASRQVLAQVATTIAHRGPAIKYVRAAGRIDYAETEFRQISTRFAGRVEKLYITYTGQRIRKGDPVAEIYSPEAISAQQEYVLASEAYLDVKDAPEMIAAGAKSLVDQSREKLLQWGFTEAQIARLDSTKSAQNSVTIYSPINGTVLKKNVDPQHYATAGEDLFDVADLSRVWMEANIYEVEIGWFKPGQKMTATSDAYPGTVFSGTVNFISPVVDPSTRTVLVRVEFANPGERLRPGMYVNSTAAIPLPASLLVPASAVLSTGNRTVVWVQKSAERFEPRLVRLGARAGENVQILDGLKDGDRVVTSGGYLLDSESQLQAATAS
jgi:membrane fusion protein, copper/silver efflux system